MKARYLLSTIFVLFIKTAIAQTVITGTVTEEHKTTKLNNVFIRNVSNKQIALSDEGGHFDIKAAAGNTLIFTLPGYISDTLYLTDLKPKHIQLKQAGITLSEVSVHETANFNPREEYPEVYEKSKFALSPSRWFGKESRDARRLKRYFDNEEQQRQIDKAFNKTLVSSIIPLRGAELDGFMALYRPSLSFVKTSSPQTMTVYINDSYRKFMALPPDKRVLPRLGTDQ
ncbi:hypothetical protein BEL04_17455 [Mucilaginibacter sp. PPCGB 2223]|uniref:hypothetical protein n=1 Tax=Mucilaginibacter sp. PPCGB 2223 TaxID=1886027 RepID=UPI000824EB2B|nr:hypothetical protein [Mucilaginibacter sp. PPCGB 2223]OCX51799.1 hypothetical protein BEL04_17455 [Mucilaginibacter sp. PPCGB 2223]